MCPISDTQNSFFQTNRDDGTKKKKQSPSGDPPCTHASRECPGQFPGIELHCSILSNRPSPAAMDDNRLEL